MKKSLSFLIASLLQVGTSLQKQQVCHALAMSGGANKGAYEAGVVYGLAHNLPASEVAWDVITGVSAGAINAAGMSVFPVGQEKEMSEFMVKILENLHSEMIYDYWPGGLVEGVLSETGVLDSTPLLNFLTSILVDQFPDGPQRRMVVSAVDVETGSYTTFTEKEPKEKIPAAVLASASIPFVFPNRHIGDQIFMDGGTVWNTNLVSAVDRCHELVDDDSQIVIDIILCGGSQLNKTTSTGYTMDNYMRYQDIKNYYGEMNDVLEFKQTRPNVNYRYLFIPSEPLTSGFDELVFDNSTIFPMTQIGIHDALKALNLEEGIGFEMLEEWSTNPELKKQHPRFENYFHSI